MLLVKERGNIEGRPQCTRKTTPSACQEMAMLAQAIKYLCLPLLKKVSMTMRRVERGGVQISPSSVCQEDSLVPQTLKPSGLISRQERVVSRQLDAQAGRPAPMWQTPSM